MLFHYVDDAQRQAAPRCCQGGPLCSGERFIGTIGRGDDWRDHGLASIFGSMGVA